MVPSKVATGAVAPKTASHGANSQMTHQISAPRLPFRVLGRNFSFGGHEGTTKRSLRTMVAFRRAVAARVHGRLS
jgi:hypothetical protein